MEFKKKELKELKVISYYLGKTTGEDIICLEYRGAGKWAITCAGSCMNKLGTWNYECLPSNRPDNYYKLNRWSSAQKALDFWESIRKQVHEAKYVEGV